MDDGRRLRDADILGEGAPPVVHDIAEHFVADPERLHGAPHLHHPPGDVGAEDEPAGPAQPPNLA